MQKRVKRVAILSSAIAITGLALLAQDQLTFFSFGWPQWGQNPQHQGFTGAFGQPIQSQLADIIYDPLVPQEQAFTGGELLAHYQVPILDGQDVFMEFKTGDYSNPFNSQVWHEKRLHWEGGQLVTKWDFTTDWKPEPIDFAGGWEPVFHAVLTSDSIYVPGFGGSIIKLNRGAGNMQARISPFGSTVDPNTFVASPLSADNYGNIYYNAIKLDPTQIDPFTGVETTVGSWLVKVRPDGTSAMVSFSVLIPDAPTTCVGRFPNSQLPWPPSPTAMPTTTFPCGIARVGLNVAPAIARDGTVYTVGRVDNSPRYGWVIAVNPDLTRKWDTSMRNLFPDGCGVTIPIATTATPTKGTCRFGAVTSANFGVDPTTNRPGDGNVIDQSSSSPTVLPDGNVLYGSYTRYNIARGHLIKFNGATGAVMAFFDFGWDSTAAVFSHDDDYGGGSYSIVIKDNHYDEEAGFYCNPDGNGDVSDTVCASTGIPAGPFYITQLNPNLVPEWKFHSIETNSCTKQPDGTLKCVSDHPNGFEWCINAPAVDGTHKVYVESEDGHAYVIPPGHTGIFDMNTPGVQRLFLQLALGAAYTPLSIGADGKIYAQNAGHLFVLGSGGKDPDFQPANSEEVHRNFPTANDGGDK
jgi:hypothetical protein